MPRVIPPDQWVPRGIDALEENALEVVRSTGSYAVIAGPGAGKTELLAQRAGFLLETGACPHPRRILAISFKRDAARNLRERVERRSGRSLARRFDSFTYDAFAKAILDQFLSALPARLRPTAQYDVITSLQQPDIETILRGMTSPPSALGSKGDLLAFATRPFFEKSVPRVVLEREPTTLEGWAAREFVHEFLRGPRSRLSFALIMRLAGYLLTTDQRLRRAYRSAYTHLFLDEFQDTTAMQYWLTKTLFLGTDAVLTAVGDPHQMIMGWAGAVKGVFGKFEIDFGARSIPLVRNYRASAELAPLVRFLAAQMHAAAGSVPAIEAGSGPPKEACSADVFENDDDEAAWIAGQVVSLIEDGTRPREIAFLARMKAADYTSKIIAALEIRGVLARVEDALQDLLVEPIVQAVMLALRALATAQPATHWSDFRSLIGDARGLEDDDAPRWQQLEAELGRARAALRAINAPPGTAEALRSLLEAIVEPFLPPVRLRFAQYARGTFYEDCLSRVATALAGEARQDTWEDALDAVEGVGTVPILTIHKSKGLEYDAVYFVGLEDGAFWNFQRTPDEEMNAFYVAISRAKKRVVFTFSKVRTLGGRPKRQSLSEIGKIYDLLKKAEVHIERHVS